MDVMQTLADYAKKYDAYMEELSIIYDRSVELNKKLKFSPTPELYQEIEKNLKDAYALQFKVDKLMKLTEFLKLDNK